ncbi:hypothetical protein [Sediminicola luteus]|nr:hypothetical protein [Sediminicola luteus]
MGLKTKSILYNFLAFAPTYIILRWLFQYFLTENTLVYTLVPALIAMVLAPRFKAVKTEAGEGLFMRWTFIKGVRRID